MVRVNSLCNILQWGAAMLKDSQIKMLMLMHDMEEMLGDIYELFASQHPAHSALWSLLVREERLHAGAIRTLYRLTYEGRSLFDEGVIKADALQSIMEYMQETYARAKKGAMTAEQAIATACDFENTLIEKHVFDLFRVAQEFQVVLQKLKHDTQHHAEMAKKELRAVRGG